ncbi:MAG TPA: GNAT family N-acetyltransferase [Solirubrobacteraceae bacterium]
MEFGQFEQAERLTEQRELFEDAFPENKGAPPASVETYRWKFHGFPASPPSYEYMALEDGRMVGYYAAIPYRYQIGGSMRRVGMACDVMTHSQARGKGVFTSLGRYSLAEMQQAGVDLMTGYPIRPGVMGGHLRVGWTIAFELPMYLHPLKSNAILRSKRLGWLAPPVNVGIGIFQRLLGGRSSDAGLRVNTGPAPELLRSEAFAEFVQRWSQSVPNHLIKSADFYDWRLAAPGTQYQAFLAQRDEQIVAAAVVREQDLQGIPSLALLDLMVVDGEERTLGLLYRTIADQARRLGVEAVVTMMSKHSAKRYRLARHGFLKSPFTFKLIVKALREDISAEDLCSEADWHLMWIDSDDL